MITSALQTIWMSIPLQTCLIYMDFLLWLLRAFLQLLIKLQLPKKAKLTTSSSLFSLLTIPVMVTTSSSFLILLVWNAELGDKTLRECILSPLTDVHQAPQKDITATCQILTATLQTQTSLQSLLFPTDEPKPTTANGKQVCMQSFIHSVFGFLFISSKFDSW